MIRLLLVDLVANTRVWLGALAVTATAGFILGIEAAAIRVGSLGCADQALVQIGAVSLTLTLIALLVVLVSVANLTVLLLRRGYALWQLVGVRPGSITGIVLGQLLVVAIVGTAIGGLIAMPLAGPVLHAVLDPLEILGRFVVPPTAALSPWIVAGVAVVVVLGGLRGARQAARVPPLEALRDPEPPAPRLGVLRIVTAVVLVVGVVAMALGFPHEPLSAIVSQCLLVTPLLAASFTAVGPWLFPLVLRGWTALVPGRVSVSWHLARNSARARLGLSTAAVSPLLVAVALLGGLRTLALILAVREGVDPSDVFSSESAVILLGGPLLLCGMAAAATVLMSSRSRARESALVSAAGAAPGRILLAAVWESVIYAVTAALLASVAIGAGAVILAVSLQTPIGFDLPVLVQATLGGLALLLVATVVPTATGLRTPIPRALSPE